MSDFDIVFEKRVAGGSSAAHKENDVLNFEKEETAGSAMSDLTGLFNETDEPDTSDEEPIIENDVDSSDQFNVSSSPTIPEVDVISSDDVIIEDERYTTAKIGAMGSENGILYKTGDVARILGTSDQNIRNYTEYFKDLLSVEKKPSGHRLYTKSDIETLRTAITVKQKKGLTMEQTLEFLKGSAQSISNIPQDLTFNVMLNLIYENVEESVKKAIADNQKALLAENTMLENKCSDVIEKASSAISMLSDELDTKNKQIESLEKISKKYEEIIESLIKKNDDYESVIKDFNESQNENAQALRKAEVAITELKDSVEKKKKKIFGLFG